MKTFTVSAPGKLLLMGEHSVVYGHPCIVTAVNHRMYVTASEAENGMFIVDAPDVSVQGYTKQISDLGKDPLVATRFIEKAVSAFITRHGVKIPSLHIETHSDFSPLYGFGSSSAVTVCVLSALSHAYSIPLTHEELFSLAYSVVLEIQGKASGFDVAAAVYGGTLYFVTGGKKVEALLVPPFTLTVGYTGIKADTPTVVAEIADKRAQFPDKVERIFSAITQLVEQGKKGFISGDFERVGKLFDFNQDYLRDLGVSSRELESLIVAAKEAGAYGAKLSGAGRGDCMIALSSKEKQEGIARAIAASGGKIIPVEIGAQGVRVETADNQNEMFIVVDENDNVIGYRTRRECHADASRIHRVIGVHVFDTKGRVLLQKRSMKKDMEGGVWGAAVAGHVEKGETYEQAAIRELAEELGITGKPVFFGKFVVKSNKETEMVAGFTLTHEGPFTFSDDETDELRFFVPDQLRVAIKEGTIRVTEGTRVSLSKLHIL